MQRKRLWILAGILLVVGGALYLLTSLPALAYIVRTTHTTVDDFNRGEFYHTGMTKRDDGEVTLLALGVAGDWVVTDVVGLPPVYAHALVQHNGYVYVIGGRMAGNVLTRSVFVSRIHTETNWLEPFATTTPLPEAVYPAGVFRHTAVVVGDYVYVLGGQVNPVDDNALSDSVLFAPFNPDGTLGQWQAAASLPEQRSLVPAVELNDRIYVLGGSAGSGYATDAILHTLVNSATGQLTGWVTATGVLPYPAFGHMATAYGGRLYLLGGYDPVAGSARPDVHFAAPVASNGDITAGGWIPTMVLPTNMYGGVALAFNGELFALGGVFNFPLGNPTGYARAALIDIETGKIMTDEVIPDGWFESPAMEPARAFHGAVLGPNNRHIYVLGGTSGGLNPLTSGMLNRGATTGTGGGVGFARSGWYSGPMIELGRERRVLNFNWTVEFPSPAVLLTLQYRTQPLEGGWGTWTTPDPGSPVQTGTMYTYTVPFEDVAAFRFEYRAWLTTTQPLSYTPILHRFELVYDVAEPPQFDKQADPPSGQDVLQGQYLTYTLPFFNPNSYALNHVVIVDMLPVSVTYLAGSATSTLPVTPTYDGVARMLQWDIGALPAQTGGQVSFAVLVDSLAPPGTLLENRARFRSNNTDDVNRFTTHRVAVLGSVMLDKLASPPGGSKIWPDQTITYTMIYSNPNNMALDIIVTDTLPGNIMIDACTPDCDFVLDFTALRWTVPAVPPLTEGQVQYRVIVQDASSGTVLTNTAIMRGKVVGVEAYTSIAATDPITHTVVDAVPPQISKRADPPSGASVSPGDPIAYTLVYTNASEATLTRVTLVDPRPANVSLVSGCDAPDCVWDGSKLHWTLNFTGGLLPAQSGQVSFTVEVDPLAGDGALIANTGYAIGCVREACTAEAASIPTTHQVEVLVSSLLRKLADPPGGERVTLGERITYTLVYTNLGDAALSDVTVSDALPPGVSLVPGSCAPACSANGGTLVWTIGTLAPHASGQASFVVALSGQLVDGAPIHNVASLDSSGGAVQSNKVTHGALVPYDLAITKSDGVQKANPGDVLTYSLAYTNIVPAGIVTLTNVVITEELLSPCCVTFLPAPAWNVISPTMVTYSVGTLGPNQWGKLSLAVKISDSLESELSVFSVRNQATIGDDGAHGIEPGAYLANNLFVDSDAVRGPDLVLRNVQVPQPTYPRDTILHVGADVVNQGVSPALSWEDAVPEGKGKWIAAELYVKPSSFQHPGAPQGSKDHAGGWCAVETAPCPAASQRMEYLSFIVSPTYPLGEGESASVAFDVLLEQAGVYSLYLQVDIANLTDPDYGRVKEADEDNNVVFLRAITVESAVAKIYLPVILKNARETKTVNLPVVLK